MALPLTIFIVALLTVVLAAAFVRVDAERQMAVGGSDAVDAQTVAESGLQRYVAYRDSLGIRPPDGDSVRINLTGGYADVTAYVMQRPADTLANEMYVVRSTGYVITPRLGPVPQATRTVAQFAQWQSSTIDVVAAYTAANKVTGSASAPGVRISGRDACGRAPDAAGMVTVKQSNLRGTSGVSPSYVDTSSNGSTVASLAAIDWSAIDSAQALIPDYRSFHPFDTSYPTMLVSGDLTLQNTYGYGLLIVTGDLTLQGWFDSFRGVLLVGGKIDFLAPWTFIRGAVKSGLNEQLRGASGNTATGSVGSGFLSIRYDSCEITKALQSLAGFAPIRNARVDSWGSY